MKAKIIFETSLSEDLEKTVRERLLAKYGPDIAKRFTEENFGRFVHEAFNEVTPHKLLRPKKFAKRMANFLTKVLWEEAEKEVKEKTNE